MMATKQVFTVASLALIRNAQGQVLVLRERDKFAKDPAAPCIDVPGGRIVAGESLDECLRNRVMEETGFTIKSADVFWAQEYRFETPDAQWQVVGICYDVVVDPLPDVKLGAVHDQYQWIDPGKHKDYALFPNIYAVFEKYLNR